MTITEHLTGYLTKRGLWPHEATAVMDNLKAGTPAMEGRWDEDAEGYPDSLFAVLVMSVDQAALEWIDANKPKHFARPMFVSNP